MRGEGKERERRSKEREEENRMSVREREKKVREGGKEKEEDIEKKMFHSSSVGGAPSGSRKGHLLERQPQLSY